jgi:hypothetical protein
MVYVPDRAWDAEADVVAADDRRGLLHRLVGVADSAGTTSLALLVGGLGAAAFVASMAYPWEKVALDLTPLSNGFSASTLSTYELTPAPVDGLGTVYVWVMLALLATIGAALAWPHTAVRLRVLATGVGVGMIGILIALTLRLAGSFVNQQGVPTESQAQLKVETTHQLGLYFGFAAVVLCVAAVWLAGPSIQRRSAGSSRVPVQPSTIDIRPHSGTFTRCESGPVAGLTVTAADPLDENVHPGDPWRR